ncbi:restriction endonuclease subunit S [Geminocystis herdmanii]|uniref:restriction endonuclease subunit S n=1 Tax=Geminocystis herdmanii TaxID=669359 RepID=UPI00036E8C53|nr:restriction endonuclease subunit S [Geminocystis herdmanii]
MSKLLTDFVLKEVEKIQRGASYPAIRDSELKNLEIPLPPLEEQKKIARVLTFIQEAIEEQERAIALTTELKQNLMQKLFTEGLNNEPQKMTEIGLIPESWEVMKFEDFTVLQRGKDLTKANFKNGNIPVAASSGIIGYHNIANVKDSGVTVGRSGSVGSVKYYDSDFWAHNTTLFVKDFKGNDKKFTAYYLEFLNLSRFKTGASVPTLDRNSFKKLPISLPKKMEQIEIAKVLDLTQEKIDFILMKKEQLQELFKILLHQLMTAKIRVDELDLSVLTPKFEEIKGG